MSDRISVYEAMFLINQSEAADFNGAIAHIEEILHRGQAELVSMRKWDERRLAYEIDKQRRGVYILTYFRAPTKSIAHIERDCNLSERIMRVLILSAEHLTDEEIASQNDREGLKVEARLRAERAADAASRTPEPEPVDAE
jgi:small subunit ribosomal protein S6